MNMKSSLVLVMLAGLSLSACNKKEETIVQPNLLPPQLMLLSLMLPLPLVRTSLRLLLLMVWVLYYHNQLIQVLCLVLTALAFKLT